MATAAASTTEQKKDKIVKEKKEKVVKEKKAAVGPLVPPPIMIPATSPVTEKVLVRSPQTPDHPPPHHIKELFRSMNKQ
jgi:hypothetical protein